MTSSPERIFLAGASRAGTSVVRALLGGGHRAVGFWNRSEPRAAFADLGPRHPTLDVTALEPTLVIVAVSDDAIAVVASELERGSGAFFAARAPLLIHLSGSLASDVLGGAAPIGSLHPLRSFATAESGPDALRGTPCAIEARDPRVSARLAALALQAGAEPFRIEAADKPLYHLAAVAAANFLVALLGWSEELASRAGMPPEAARAALVALARTALENVATHGPRAALTGPFARGDVGVVSRHLACLANEPIDLELYRRLGRLAARVSGSAGEAIAARLADGAP